MSGTPTAPNTRSKRTTARIRATILRKAATDHRSHATALREARTDHRSHATALREAATDHRSRATALREAATDHRSLTTALREAATDHRSLATALLVVGAVYDRARSRIEEGVAKSGSCAVTDRAYSQIQFPNLLFGKNRQVHRVRHGFVPGIIRVQ